MIEKNRNNPSAYEYSFGPEWFRIRQLTDNIWGIREPFHFEDVLSYYIKGNNASVLIDSGMGLADISSVLPNIKDATVLLTHSHWDHIGGAVQFANVSIFNHPFEAERLKRGWQPEEMVGFSEKNFHLSLPNGFSPEQFTIPGINQFSTFTEDDIIDLGGLTIQILHTPGHTPGSVCFFIPEKGYLFTGDTLYAGPEYIHMQESSPSDYFQSLGKLYAIIGDNLKLIFPGHNDYIQSPTLLYKHLLASQGKIDPESITEGEEEFGPFNKKPFIEKKWSNFSFRLPKR